MFPKLQYQACVTHNSNVTHHSFLLKMKKMVAAQYNKQIHFYAHLVSFALQEETSIESTTQVDASQREINLCSNRLLPRDFCTRREFMEDNFSRLKVPSVTSK